MRRMRTEVRRGSDVPHRTKRGLRLLAGLLALAAASLTARADLPLQHLSAGPVTPVWDVHPGLGYKGRTIAGRQSHAAISPDGSRLYAMREELVTAYRTSDGAEVWNSAQVQGGLVEIAVGPDDHLLGLYFRLGEVFVVSFEGATGTQLWRQQVAVSDATLIEPLSIAVSASGTVAATWRRPGGAYEMAALAPLDGASLWTIVLPRLVGSKSADLEFSPDGQKVLALAATTVDTWDAFAVHAVSTADGTLVWEEVWVSGVVTDVLGETQFVPFGDSRPHALDVSPDGSTVVAVGETRAVCLPSSGPAFSGAVQIAAFAHDTTTGDRLWSYLPDAEGGSTTGDPCVEGGDAAIDVEISSTGQVIIAGESLPPDPASSTSYDAYTVSLGLATGAVLWSNRDGPQGLQAQHQSYVEVTPDGSTAVVAGTRELDPDDFCPKRTYATVAGISTIDGTTTWRDTWTFGCDFGPTLYQDLVLSPDGSRAYPVALSQFVAQWLTALAFDAAPVDTPPVITAVDLTYTATRPDGVYADYSDVVEANDAQDGPVPVTCDPDSGSFFGLGNTVVTCSASDSAGHVTDASFILTVDPKATVPLTSSLWVRCLHEPLFPAAGQPVTIRVEALTADVDSPTTDPVVADELEIWLDQSGPAATGTGVHELRLDTVAVGLPPSLSMPYACRVRVGSEVAFSGWRRTATVDRNGAIPVVYTGPTSERLDVVFVADADSYDDASDPDFLADVHRLIRNAYYDFPLFAGLGGGDRFNFWIAKNTGTADGYVGGTCRFTKPDRWKQDYGFADVGAILHTDNFRDCAWRGMFTTEPVSFATAIHETGHRPFGLADEYEDDGGYFQTSLNANVYRTLQACEANAADLGYPPSACRSFIAKDGKDWFVADPASDDMMVDNRTPRAADIRRILWLYSRCAQGEC